MSSRADSSITVRPLRFEEHGIHHADLATAERICAATDMAVIGTVETGLPQLMEWFLLPMTDRAVTGFVVRDGEPVGVLWVCNDATAQETFMVLNVPPHPESSAICTAGLAQGIAAARNHQAGAGGGAWTLRCRQWVGDDTLGRALEELGFAPARRFLRMRIDSASPLIPVDAPATPEGVEFVLVRSEEERREVHFTENEAFADHWNDTPREWDEWWSFHADSPSFDPDGWWLMRVDGEPAAILIMEETLTDMNIGYVGILGVRRAYRGRGLAQFLLQRAFVRFRDMGRVATQLGVDSESPTGAVGLYEKVGMSTVQITQGWAIELDWPTELD